MAKMFFLSSSSDGLVQNYDFHNGFCTKQHFTLSSARAHHFFTTSKTYKALETIHSRTMTSIATPFSSLVHMNAHKST